MKSWLCGLAGLLVALCVPFQSSAQQASPSAVKTLSPGGAITPTERGALALEQATSCLLLGCGALTRGPMRWCRARKLG